MCPGAVYEAAFGVDPRITRRPGERPTPAQRAVEVRSGSPEQGEHNDRNAGVSGAQRTSRLMLNENRVPS